MTPKETIEAMCQADLQQALRNYHEALAEARRLRDLRLADLETNKPETLSHE
jgi:hypothetical protein